MSKRRHLRGVTDELQIAARELRRAATPAEAALWEALRAGRLDGLKFRRQHALRRFVLDFYCPSSRLAIELDGGKHDEPDQAMRDQARTLELAQYGYRVVRFRNEEVLYSLPPVLERISREARAPVPPLPHAGEGAGG